MDKAQIRHLVDVLVNYKAKYKYDTLQSAEWRGTTKGLILI